MKTKLRPCIVNTSSSIVLRGLSSSKVKLSFFRKVHLTLFKVICGNNLIVVISFCLKVIQDNFCFCFGKLLLLFCLCIDLHQTQTMYCYYPQPGVFNGVGQGHPRSKVTLRSNNGFQKSSSPTSSKVIYAFTVESADFQLADLTLNTNPIPNPIYLP